MLFVLVIGFLLGLAFYFRFQVGFAIAGFGAWLLFVEKRYKDIPFLAIGFLLAMGLNTYLDYEFYGRFVFTPYQYYHVNITEGKAASFGTSSFVQYLVVLLGFLTVPPLSIFLLYLIIKAVFKEYKHPFVLPVLFFIVGHSMIAHKEERFIFPVFVVLPVIIGLVLPSFINYYKTTKRWIHYSIKGIAIFSITLNLVMLAALLFNPYAQTVYFTSVLKNEFKEGQVSVFCYRRTPFQTESLLPLTFYRKSVTNINFIKFSESDSIRQLTGKPVYLTTTYNQVKNDIHLIDSLGFKPVHYSSRALWKVNEFLETKKMNTINDIWVLYKKE